MVGEKVYFHIPVKWGSIQIFVPKMFILFPLHNVQFVKYDVTVSFMAQVLDTVTYLVPQVLDTAS